MWRHEESYGVAMSNNDFIRRYYGDAGWLIMRCAEVEFTFGSLLGMLKGHSPEDARVSAIANWNAAKRADAFLEAVEQAGKPIALVEAAKAAVPLYKTAALLRNRISHGYPVERDGATWIVHWVPARQGREAHMNWCPMDLDEVHAAIDAVQRGQQLLLEGLKAAEAAACA